MPRPTAVLSFSGGMDSTTLAGYYDSLDHELTLVSVNYGQRHVRELDAARAVASHYAADHLIVDATGIGQLLTGSALTDNLTVPEGHYTADTMTATVVPNRNAILANICIGIAVARKADVVALGVHAGDHAIYPDCRPEFVDALRELVNVATAGLHTPMVEAPFVHSTKTEIAALGGHLGVPFHLTWSCYNGGAVHCGRCGTCVERAEAMHDAGIVDPTEYESPDYWRTVVEQAW